MKHLIVLVVCTFCFFLNTSFAQKVIDGGIRFPIMLPSLDNFDFKVDESTGWTGFDMTGDYSGRSKILLGLHPERPFGDVFSIVTLDKFGAVVPKLSLNSDGGALFKGKVELINSDESSSAGINFNWQLLNSSKFSSFNILNEQQNKLTFWRKLENGDGYPALNFSGMDGNTLTFVGVGTVNPQFALDVNGTVNSTELSTTTAHISGDMQVNGRTTLARGLNVNSDVGINGELNVTGNAKFGESISLSQNVSGYTLKLKTLGTEDWGIEHSSLLSDALDWYGMGLRIMDNGNNGFYIRDKTSGQMRMVIRGGKVGIGKTSPLYALDVNGTVNASDIRVNGNSLMDKLWIPVPEGLGYNGKVGVNTLNPQYDLDVDGVINAQDILINGNSIGDKLWMPVKGGLTYDGNIGIGTSEPKGKIHIAGDIVAGNDVFGQKFIFHTRGENNGDFLQITGDDRQGKWQWNKGITFVRLTGNVGIGTTNPQEKLSVNGTILSKEVEVSIDPAKWPDYVFEENYETLSLEDLNNYIKNNKHLPEIPTVEKVKEDGVQLGEISAKLLEKVEELTLYLIKQNEQIKQLSSELDELKKTNK